MGKFIMNTFKTLFCKHVWLKESYGYSGIHYVCIFCDKEVFKKPRGIIVNEEGRLLNDKETYKTNL